MAIEKETEERIYEAARGVFHERGFDGARMQEIADRAGINKALLHYYFRSKDQLFEKVFRAAVTKLFPRIVGSLQTEGTVRERVERFVALYIDTLKANPFVPGFILHELSKNPNRMKTLIPELVGHLLSPFLERVRGEMEQGKLPLMDPRQFLLNMFSMCVFPFIAKPILDSVFQFDAAGFDAFLEERKRVIPQVLCCGGAGRIHDPHGGQPG